MDNQEAFGPPVAVFLNEDKAKAFVAAGGVVNDFPKYFIPDPVMFDDGFIVEKDEE